MTVTYPLDITGNNPSNLVTNELHSVQESQFRDYYFIVPNFAPFYVNNFNITLTVNNVTTTLVEDVDYSFIMPYITGTRVTGHAMYGAITLHNINANGILSLTYQTLGGDMVVDRLEVLTMLANLAYNPRSIAFDLVANTPSHWPPEPHQNEYNEYYGQEELVAALDRVKDAILTNSINTANEIQNLFTLLNSGTFGNYILKSGGTMTGPLILSGPPIQPQQAATKEYVDNNAVNTTTINSLLANYATRQYVDAQDNLKVSKTGDNMTGPLSLSGPPIQSSHATTKQYVDAADATKVAKAGDIMTGALTLHGDPTSNLHAAPKQYVDSTVATHASNNSLHLTASQNTFLDGITVTHTEVNQLAGIASNVQVQLDTKVSKAGGTMTGPLILSGPPIQPQQAATKEYVDNNAVNTTTTINSLLANYATRQYVDAQDNLKVSKTGDNMTGPLSLSGPPIQSSHATTKQYVDNIESNLQAQINNLQAQINTINSDPVTKSYVDNRIYEILAIILKNY